MRQPPPSNRGGRFDPPWLLARVQSLAPDSRHPLRCVVAFSGGLDSVALLHCLSKARTTFPGRLSVRAVHVDHHLQAAAPRFRAFCGELARQLRVPLLVLDVRVRAPRGGSVEESARIVRYRALRSQLQPGEILLTGQHADDQMETVLLALLRGAGPAGLAAMPATTPFGAGQLVRPLLEVGRAALFEYLAAAGQEWIEDPTNAQLRFDRNYLRAEVVPRLRDRWPSVAQTMGRSARHCAEAVALLAQRAQRDLDLACDGPDLEVAVLRRWDRMRQKAVLRGWFAQRGVRCPDERRLDEALRMFDARPDSTPMLAWPGARLRRYAGLLTVEATGGAEGGDIGPTHGHDDTAVASQWDWRRPLALPGGSLAIRGDAHGDLDLDRLPASVGVWLGASREGGRSLRGLLQELQVPNWQRASLPLLYEPVGKGRGRLLAVRDLWLAGSLRSGRGTCRRGRIVWRDSR